MAETTEPRPPVRPRLVPILVALLCGGGAVGVALYAPALEAGKKKKPPVTEEWTGPAPLPAAKPAGPEKPKDPDEPKDPPKDDPKSPKEIYGLVPPGGSTGGTTPKGQVPPKPPAIVTGRDEKVVVRLQNARRVFGNADADNIEVDYEVLRTGFAIMNDTAIVTTKTGAVGFKVSAPDKTGTLTIPAAVPARTSGTVELWIVLRRNGEDLTSNAVTVK